MTNRLQNLMLAMLLALSTLFMGLGNLSQNLTSGGYQLFEQVESGFFADKSLNALGNLTPPLKTASECCKAPNTGVKHASGVSLPKSQTQMVKDFDLAGYPTKPVISPTSGKNVGTQYTLPDGSRVRVMQADSRSPKRASFENANGHPIDPTTGKPPQPPSGMTRAERKKYVRERTHIVQDD